MNLGILRVGRSANGAGHGGAIEGNHRVRVDHIDPRGQQERLRVDDVQDEAAAGAIAPLGDAGPLRGVGDIGLRERDALFDGTQILESEGNIRLSVVRFTSSLPSPSCIRCAHREKGRG